MGRGRDSKRARMTPPMMQGWNPMMAGGPMMGGWNPMMAAMMGSMNPMMMGGNQHVDDGSSSDEGAASQAKAAPVQSPMTCPPISSSSAGADPFQDAAAVAIHNLKERRSALYQTSADKIITRSAAMIRSLPKDRTTQTCCLGQVLEY